MRSVTWQQATVACLVLGASPFQLAFAGQTELTVLLGTFEKRANIRASALKAQSETSFEQCAPILQEWTFLMKSRNNTQNWSDAYQRAGIRDDQIRSALWSEENDHERIESLIESEIHEMKRSSMLNQAANTLKHQLLLCHAKNRLNVERQLKDIELNPDDPLLIPKIANLISGMPDPDNNAKLKSLPRRSSQGLPNALKGAIDNGEQEVSPPLLLNQDQVNGLTSQDLENAQRIGERQKATLEAQLHQARQKALTDDVSDRQAIGIPGPPQSTHESPNRSNSTRRPSAPACKGSGANVCRAN